MKLDESSDWRKFAKVAVLAAVPTILVPSAIMFVTHNVRMKLTEKSRLEDLLDQYPGRVSQFKELSDDQVEQVIHEAKCGIMRDIARAILMKREQENEHQFSLNR